MNTIKLNLILTYVLLGFPFESKAGAVKVIELFPSKVRSHNLHVLINGGMHGNEQLSPDFVQWLMKRYKKGKSQINRLKFDFSIDFLPISNPTGLRNNSRYNQNGVNLNRNFPVLWGLSRENPGKTPASEKETKAIISLFKKRQYDLAIDIHGYVNWVVAPTSPRLLEKLTSRKVSTSEYRLYEQWTESMQKNLKYLQGYELKSAGAMGDGGAFEDYAFWSEGVVTFCLEIHQKAKVKRYRTSEYLRYENYIAHMLVETNQIIKSSESFVQKEY